MPGQLVAFCLLWNFVLFLAPGPAYGDFNSGDCTAEVSPGKTVCAHIMGIFFILWCFYTSKCEWRSNAAQNNVTYYTDKWTSNLSAYWSVWVSTPRLSTTPNINFHCQHNPTSVGKCWWYWINAITYSGYFSRGDNFCAPSSVFVEADLLTTVQSMNWISLLPHQRVVFPLLCSGYSCF